MAIRRVFVANRGEIAVRIIRAARSLGIETVQAHSEADSDMMPVRMADQAVCIGPAKAADSYLNAAAIVAAAKASGSDAVHPGYGFLSESAAFARAVEDAGLAFVGPSPDVLGRMGDKAAARSAAIAAGVPVVPGSEGRLGDVASAVRAAGHIGFPVMIKAAAGGGGRGIRVAVNEDELRRLIPQAQAEALAAFGDDGFYLERAISNARHVEVQILGDGTQAIHAWERECSVQRRRQKVWEEARSPMSDDLRGKLCEGAAALARSVGYRGAGTLEYLWDEASDEVFFIEMNTRIQVEHPVTEMLTGIDLVAEMLRIAGGEPLRHRQQDVVASGHAIEVRICAEDPLRGFAPFPGRVGTLTVPEGARFDHFLYEGYVIPPFYDSLLGKLIVHAADRPSAIDAMREALGGLSIGGVRTTIPLHRALCDDPEIRSGRVHTQWLEPWLAAGGLIMHKTIQGAA